MRNFSKGECIDIPSASGDDGAAHALTVPCFGPHMLEIVGSASVPDNVVRFPTADAWPLYITQACGPLVVKYLGAPLDPRGKYVLKAIHPLATMWALGSTPPRLRRGRSAAPTG